MSGTRNQFPRPRAKGITSRPAKGNFLSFGLIVSCTGVALLAAALGAPAYAAEALTKPAKITFDDAGALVVDGQKRFPINLTVVPGPAAKAPNGRPAYAEFADCGVLFMRSGGPAWTEQAIEHEKAMQAAAAAAGMRCCPWLGWDLSNFAPEDQGIVQCDREQTGVNQEPPVAPGGGEAESLVPGNTE